MSSSFSITFGDSSIELPPGDSIIGRDLSCRVRFADLRVSRRHMRICVSQGRATVEDLGSSNGTRLNGVAVCDSQPLRDGDLLELGNSTRLRVKVGAAHLAFEASETMEPDTLLVQASEIFGASKLPGAGLGRIHTMPTDADADDEDDSFADYSPNGERRQHARAVIPVPVCYDSETLNLSAHARDLSDGGVFIVSELLDQIGTSCEMTIELQGLRSMRAKGVVRRVVLSDSTASHPPGMGIQFTELTADSRA